MSSYKTYLAAANELKDMAERHNVIRHGQPVSETDNTPRNSFFFSDNEMGVRQANAGAAGVHYPYMIVSPMFNKYERDGDVYRSMFMGFEIRTRVNDRNNTAEINEAMERVMEIAEQVAAWMVLKSEEEMQESPFFAMDVDSLQGDYPGFTQDDEIGYLMRWKTKQGAWNPFRYEPGDFFDLTED